MIDIEKMKKYNELTTKKGIVMPDLDSFNTKVELAISLWPQKNSKGEIDYLFGKGVGVELALRGQVVGRTKNPVVFPYRSHSDFEIYDCNGYNAIPESIPFRQVFGSHEWYPKTYTKGLHEIEEGLMDSTYDTVIYNGKEYLVPELELLFLDKYVRQESTPRKEGCDAILLMKQYKLDIDKINRYYDRYVKKYKLDDYDRKHSNSYNGQLISIARIVAAYKKEFEVESVENIPELEEFVNEQIDTWRKSNTNLILFGSPISLYPKPIRFVMDPEKGIVINEETKNAVKELITADKIKFEKALDSNIGQINDCYYEIYSDEKQYNKI